MDTIRYIVGALIVATLPPAVVFWLLIHPLAHLWKRVGPRVTYTVTVGIMLSLVAVSWRFRSGLMGTDLGFQYWVLIPSAALYLASISLEVKCRKYLNFKILAGLPEVAPDRMEPELLDEGIYGQVRHPRYLAVIFGVLGWAIFSGYTGAILVAVGMIPGLYLVTVLEERELVERFGDEYRRYRERVPRLIPRLGG